MHIRIIYGSNSGSTRAASELMLQWLKKAGHQADILDAGQCSPNDLGQSDLTIIGSSTWERFVGQEHLQGQLQQHWLELVKKIGSQKYTGQKFAVFAVGDDSFTKFCGAADELELLVKKWKGKKIGESLRLDKFYFNQPACEQQIQGWLGHVLRQVV